MEAIRSESSNRVPGIVVQEKLICLQILAHSRALIMPFSSPISKEVVALVAASYDEAG